MMVLVQDWLKEIELNSGEKEFREKAYKELKKWDPFANTQTFFEKNILKMLEKQAKEIL